MFKKILTCGLVTVALCFGAVMLAGCGGNDTQVITDGLKAELEKPKNIDEAFIEELKEYDTNGEIATIEELGISIEDYLKAMYEGYDYTMGSVTVDGDTATVPVTVTMKDMDAFVEGVDNLIDRMSSELDLASMSEEDFLAWYADEIMALIAETPVVQSEEFNVELVKKDNVWEVTDASKQLIENPQAA